MAILMTTLKVVGASILALAGSGMTYEYVAERMDERNFSPIGKMVDIGGYKLHMIDAGIAVEGQPTVVIDAGAGCNSLDWSLVQPEIAKFARVITYDRAGYAWSDASPLPRTSKNAMDELHTMLHNAGVQGPYILVGHSLGGINVRLFASKYPDEVAGVVLVDSSHEDQLDRLSIPDRSLMYKVLLGATYLGIPRLSYYIPSVKESTDRAIAIFPLEIQNVYCSQKSTIKYLNALISEMFLFKQSFDQLKEDGGLLGDKPLTVISQGKQLTLEQVKGWITPEQLETQNRVWPELQADLATKSSRGKLIVAENSSHMINYDRPDVIIEAVREMVEELRK
ncbi:alpha/beta hydrolase [Candidatus Babeliales bacterium]|nr:alpha/beta hydrolase [Candidatus Babeliales bacterium]MBP9843502.1 alpha/beta hydrolase [Candidatus Babeliales bacterium]